jgi:hypothetical protein
LLVARLLLSCGVMKTMTLATILLVASSASAQNSISRGIEGFPGKDELSAHIGFQAGLGGTTPGGFKLFLDYSHRLSNLVWLNFKVNPTFDTGSRRAICYDPNGFAYDCTVGLEGEGFGIDLLAGVKLKWLISRIHLMPYANIDGGVVPVFDRVNNDNGAAVVVHAGGGVKYFVTPRIGLGGEVNFTLGPGFYNQHNEFYRAFDLGIGAEFIL